MGNFVFVASDKLVSMDLLALFSFTDKPGTVGASADPLKSPDNFNLPLIVVVASTIVADAIWLST